jgi:hypothetical protein
MTRWEVYRAICDRLAAGLLDQPAAAAASDLPWETIVEASSQHLVTPALAWSLRGADCPPELGEYFDAVLTLNRSRNETLAATLATVAGRLNAAEIEPVLLKGAAHLATGLYPDAGLRIIGDIDLLVPADRAAAAWETLGAAGFVDPSPKPFVSLPTHHLPRLFDPATGAGVELHTSVVARAHAALLPVPWFVEGAVAASFAGRRFRIPDPTRMVAHLVVHDRMQDQGDRLATLRLRPLLDLAMLRHRHGASIDWAALRARFRQRGAETILGDHLWYAEALLGQPLPPPFAAPPPARIAALRKAVDQPEAQRRTRFAALAALYTARLRARPGVVVNLLKPALWPERIRMVRQALRPPKW